MIRQRSIPRFVNEVRIDDFEQYCDTLIVPHHSAPVIVAAEGKIIMKAMRFSLTPHWSKDERPKFATHNARLESVADKPTWRDAFQAHHCLVPLTDFVEPIYQGEFAGFMVAFHRNDRDWLFAAGIWEEWTNKVTGEVIESFAVITGDPPRFIADIGHDRCPVFLREESQIQWLTLRDQPKHMVEFLGANRTHPIYEVEKQRPMKAGWEKRK